MWQGAGFLSYTYTTEKPEKSALEIYIAYYDTYHLALDNFVYDLTLSEMPLGKFVTLINKHRQPFFISSNEKDPITPPGAHSNV